MSVCGAVCVSLSVCVVQRVAHGSLRRRVLSVCRGFDVFKTAASRGIFSSRACTPTTAVHVPELELAQHHAIVRLQHR